MVDLNAQEGYRRAIARAGETVTFQRISGQPGQGAVILPAPAGATVQAIVNSFQVEAPVMSVKREGAITLADRKIIVLVDDLAQAGFPLPLRKNDRVVVQGETLNIETVDPSTRAFAGAVELRAKGI